LKTRYSRSVRCLLLILALNVWATASVQKIGPDLYAYISENDASANSTFLVSDQGILVVDTGLNAQEGRKLLDEIRKVSQAPVRWIVNTHYHPDHRGGNSVVGPDAVIITSIWTRWRVLDLQRKEDIRNGHKSPPEYPLNEAFHGELTLYVGGHEVRIYGTGAAHTQGDAIVYFPDLRAIATGDLFLNNSCPAMDDGDLENWIVELNRMLVLPLEHIVPGHFAVARKTELEHFRDYLAALRDQVGSMYNSSFTLEQTKRSVKMTGFNDLRQFPQYEATFADNAAAYYRQLASKHPPRP
jgi:cyclase